MDTENNKTATDQKKIDDQKALEAEKQLVCDLFT